MLANRVREYTETTGTGDIALAGAMPGFVGFADAFDIGDQAAYVIEDGENYEIGTGTLTDTTVLARTSVKETLVDGVLTRSGAGAISLSGPARIYCAATAGFLARTSFEADSILEAVDGDGVTVEGVVFRDGTLTTPTLALADEATGFEAALQASGLGAVLAVDPGDVHADSFLNVEVDGTLRAVFGYCDVPASGGLWLPGGDSVVNLMFGSDNTGFALSDAAIKVGRIGVPHYMSAEEPVGVLSVVSDAIANTIRIGGATSVMNAPTTISFWTAANNTTVTGLEQWKIDATGALLAVGGNYLGRTSASGYMHVGGGSTNALGANFIAYAEGHASRPGHFLLRQNTADLFEWDASNTCFNFHDHKVAGIGDVLVSGSVYRSSDTGLLTFAGGDVHNKGGSISLWGSAHATRAGDIAFGSTGVEKLTYDHDQSEWDFKDNSIRTTAYADVGAFLALTPLSAAPSGPSNGTIAYADGTTWDPGSGEGFYGFEAGAWVKL